MVIYVTYKIENNERYETFLEPYMGSGAEPLRGDVIKVCGGGKYSTERMLYL